jgi:hypothetical protein
MSHVPALERFYRLFGENGRGGGEPASDVTSRVWALWRMLSFRTGSVVSVIASCYG